jgi:hypothetical protein
MDHNLKHLTLEMENGYNDEAGVALAEALTVNQTLREIILSVIPSRGDHYVYNKASLGDQSYKAFSAMLRVNTNLLLDLPFGMAAYGAACDQMVIEQ